MSDPRLARPLWRGRTNVDAYTISWVEHAEHIVELNWPEIAHKFDVTQGSYQIENPNREPDSGTTHLRGGVVDLHWCGHDKCLWSLRMAGGFVWHRTPEQGPWPHHVHGGPRLHPFQDSALHNQELSYMAGGNGLGGADDFRRPNPIPDPVWPWPRKEWSDMATQDEVADAVRSVVREVIREELETALKNGGQTIKIDHDRDPDTARISLERELSSD